MKKRFVPILLMALLLSVFGLSGCNDAVSYEGYVKVTFMLEGGLYQNSKRPVVHYYKFTPGTQNKIKEPNAYSEKPIERSGYHIAAWCQTRTETDGVVEYDDPWDFDTHTVTDEGITLYAKWAPNIVYAFNVCYRDAQNELQTLTTLTVNEGDAFGGRRNMDKVADAFRANNMTFIETYSDEAGNPLDATFVHPGGGEDLAINVVCDYLPGKYVVVHNASELSRNARADIYLANDIDMGGKAFNFGNYPKDDTHDAGVYKYKIVGNNKTISNFTLLFDGTVEGLVNDGDLAGDGLLCVSLFGKMQGAAVENVTFSGVTVKVDTDFSRIKAVYVAPLCVKMANSTLRNVHFSATYTITQKTVDYFGENLHVVTNAPQFLIKDGDGAASVTENCTVTVTGFSAA